MNVEPDLENRKAILNEIQKSFTCTPDFPKKGVLFRDIFGVFRKPELVQKLFHEINSMADGLLGKSNQSIDAVIGLDARGFLFAPSLALHLNCAFVPARKSGKLPRECLSCSYSLEYGTATLEVQRDAFKPGSRVLLVDDLLATGGSLNACREIAEQAGATIVGVIVVIELKELAGRDKFTSLGIPVQSLFSF